MELKLVAFIIVCPLVFLAGFVDAIGGGGGLISLPAYLFAGLPPHMAVATNKLSSSTGTLVSTIKYCVSGCVDFKLAVPGVIAALIGAQTGSRLALIIPNDAFRIVLLILLPAVGIYMLFNKKLGTVMAVETHSRKQYIIITATSLIIGVYDGFYGPGTGTFLLIAYTHIAGMNVMKASGNMKLANLASNISALAVFLINGKVLLPLGLAASAFSIAGHYLGASLAIKNGARIMRIVIILVLILLFATTLAELIGQ